MRSDRPRPTRLARLLAPLPWLVIALLAHAVVLLAARTWGRGSAAQPTERIFSVSLVGDPNPFVAIPSDVVSVESVPIPADSVEAQPDPAVDETAGDAPAAGDLDLDEPLLTNGSDGVGEDGTGGTGLSAYANRRGAARAQALARYGGDQTTEDAVEAGLAWLAAHQRSDGIFDRVEFPRRCPPGDRCAGVPVKWVDRDAEPGVTALATLAFLGAGHTHLDGPYRKAITNALSYLLHRQSASGSFAPGSRLQMYNDALATLAIAEAYGLTDDPILREPLFRAVEHLARAQQIGGGWDYTANTATRRNDSSVTGFVTMALASARAIGAPVPPRTIIGVAEHFERATVGSGRVWYSDVGEGTRFDAVSMRLQQRYGPAMTAVGMLGRQLLGYRFDALPVRQQASLLRAEPPNLRKLTGGDRTGLHSLYYVYHGTLAMFQQDPETWRIWNQATRQLLLGMQDQSRHSSGRLRHVYGSWPAFGARWGKWGRMGGRVYATALNVLTLEVYYRFPPLFLGDRWLLSRGVLEQWMRASSVSERRRLARMAANLEYAIAEPVLVDLLTDPDEETRIAAALSLAAMDSPVGAAVLRGATTGGVTLLREVAAEALARLGRLPPPGDYGAVRHYEDEPQRFVFDTAGRPTYYSQPIVVVGPGEILAEAEVIRRLPRQQAAVGRIVRWRVARRVVPKQNRVIASGSGGLVPPGLTDERRP